MGDDQAPAGGNSAASEIAPPEPPTPAAPAEAAPQIDIMADDAAIPEKFLVKRLDGTEDWEQIAKKAAAGFIWAEKKIGSLKDGGAVPDAESDYKLDYTKMPEGVQIDPEREKKFLSFLHRHKITDKQAQAFTDYYGDMLSEGMQIQTQNVERTFEQARAELREAWGAETEAKSNAINAGFKQLADENMVAGVNLLGKDLKTTYQALLKVLAKVGVDYLEDQPPHGEPPVNQTLTDLKSSDAFRKADHPQHQEVVKKVSAMEHALYTKKK